MKTHSDKGLQVSRFIRIEGSIPPPTANTSLALRSGHGFATGSRLGQRASTASGKERARSASLARDLRARTGRASSSQVLKAEGKL